MKKFLCFLFTLFILLCSCNKKEPVQNSSFSTPSISSEPEIISSLPPVVISSSSPVSTSSLPVSSVPQQQPSKITDFPVAPAAQPKEITGVSFLFENSALDPSALGQIFFYSGRLYLDSGSFLSSLQPKTAITDAIFVDPAAGTITAEGVIEKLSQPPIKVGDKNYCSLYDLSKTLHLEIKINSSGNSVSFYKRSCPPVTEHILSGEKKALLRLEDLSCNPEQSDDYCLKYRIMVNYLKQRGIIFSVAWIPKYVNPLKYMENEPSLDYSLKNIDFVYTLDYILDNGGKIGLHGYTHQKKNEISGDGYEFGKDVSLSDSAAIIEKSIGVAKRLNIPVTFFEFPHYSGTKEQFGLAERYFDLIYNPPKENQKSKKAFRKKNGDRTVTYLTAPLDYLKGTTEADISTFLIRIEKNPDDTTPSMFFHPSLETPFVTVTENNGTMAITYNENSPLKRILRSFEKKGCRFISPLDAE